MASKRKRIVFTFGRFNPPTTGHLKLIEAVAKEAGSGDYVIVPTRSFKKDKNPLKIDIKLAWMKEMFPKHAKNIITSKDLNVIIKVMQSFQGLVSEGKYTDVCMVVGSDRVDEFTTLLNKYNRDKNDPDKSPVEYGFRTIEVKSAGERDPDNDDDVSGMSASKMRAYAKAGKWDKFQDALTGILDIQRATDLMKDVRAGQGL
tara:strand:+ start:3262 stop:3867 length:606 start_codon:yes stop_codon:yes gene_type:complete